MLGIPFGAACLLVLAWSKTAGASVTLEVREMVWSSARRHLAGLLPVPKHE